LHAPSSSKKGSSAGETRIPTEREKAARWRGRAERIAQPSLAEPARVVLEGAIMSNGDCRCVAAHDSRLVVVTGGPGAGKTALLEIVRRHFCRHIEVLPEAASIVFGGGFPRRQSEPARRAGQRAIFQVQRELERMVLEEHAAAIALCDRGTLDGAAYWPGDADSFFRELGLDRGVELARYRAVLHLRTPPSGEYNHRNPLRVESVQEAAAIDARIAEAWRGHPRLFFVDHSHKFIDKVSRALELIRNEIPECCRPATQPVAA
jgi:predicted ATPase